MAACCAILEAAQAAITFNGASFPTCYGPEYISETLRIWAEKQGIPYFVLRIDHASYNRFDDRPFGKWDVWMNVINVEADVGTTEAALYQAFYGEPEDWHTAGWRAMGAFSSCVLRPLEWAGLLMETREEGIGKRDCHIFKTPLWRSALKLDTDKMLQKVRLQ